MTMTEAQTAVRVHGAMLGEVYLQVEEHNRVHLRTWWLYATGVPNLAARAARQPLPSGDLCSRCGGMMVRTGTCLTCQSCGESSGGCG